MSSSIFFGFIITLVVLYTMSSLGVSKLAAEITDRFNVLPILLFVAWKTLRQLSNISNGRHHRHRDVSWTAILNKLFDIAQIVGISIFAVVDVLKSLHRCMQEGLWGEAVDGSIAIMSVAVAAYCMSHSRSLILEFIHPR